MSKLGKFAAACAVVVCAFSASAVSTASYVQDGLIAHWDGIDNAATGEHDATAKGWVDLVAGRTFALTGVTINDDRLTFAGTASSYGQLSEADTKETFDIAGAGGTVEIVLKSDSTANAIAFQSPTTILARYNGHSIVRCDTPSAPEVDWCWDDVATNTVALHYVNAVAQDAAVNGVDSALLSGTKDYYGTSGYKVTTIGVRLAKNNVHFKGSIYAIRLYNRALTAEELAKNAQVDAMRFMGAVFADRLSVTGSPREYGEVSPAYGVTNGLAAGESLTCTAPTAWTNEEETVAAACVGYKVLVNDIVSEEGQENSFTYTHPDSETGAELVWQWAEKRRVSATAGGAGSVEVSGDSWFAKGETVTVTATPDAGSEFHHWEGDVAPEKALDPTLVFTMGEMPVSLRAAFSGVVYVSKAGSDENGGTSWDDAFATVERALASGSVPTILVGEGIYDVTTAIKVTTAAVICGSGERGTVFRLNAVPTAGDDTRAVFYVKNEGAVLRNLALTTGGSARGRGLYLSGGTVTDCSITNCVTVNGNMNGGGVYLASGTLRNSYIYYNEANSSGGYGKEGGGIYMIGGTVDRCIIRKNDACYTRGGSGSGKGGGIRMTGGTVRNCLFYDNFALSSGMALEISGGTVENCTIVRNGKTSIGYNAVNATGSPTIRNTIVRGNLSTTGSEANLSLASTVKLENVMSAGSSRSEIITSEPVFADAANGDWHILYCAAVDSGVDQTWMTTGLDLDGNARIVGKQVDLGCYEYVPSGIACGFDVTTDGALGESTVTLTGSVVGADEANVTFTWTLTDDRGNETTRAVVGSGTLELPMPIGAYAVRLAVSDGVNSAEAPERPNAFTVYAEHLYVSPEGSNEYPYGDFATAATNIEDIIAFATDGTTVHLSDGVHRLKDRLAINDGIVITHEGDPMDAVVTGGRTGTCLILLNHKDAKLSGLDICGSYPTKWRPRASAPAKAIHSGVRIMAGGTVTNCVIEGCYAKYSGGDSAQGGGIDMSAGRVVDCIIRNNREESSGGGGSYGGGVNVAGGTVDRCVITNNWASPGTGCIGGGVRITGGTLRNSLIAYCQTSGNGGGVFQTGGSVRNCTVVYNSATLGSGGISGTVTDCLKFGNDVNGMVEQGDDPGFRSAVTGDFHLSPGSAAIDASVTEGIGELDLDGNPRYQGKEAPIADKGCYESDPNVFELGVDYAKQATFYPAEVVFTATAGGPALDEEASWWTFDGREPTADDHDAIGVCVTNTLPPAEYTVRFKTVFGGQTNEVVKEKWFVLNGETVYVNPKNANPAVPYATWATAAKDINAAFPYLIAGTTMVVSDGTYQVTTEQDLNRQVTVRSLNGPAVTAFTDSGVADHPFKLNHGKAFVTGFTFKDFDTWQYGGALPMYSGTVSNCVFRNCNMWNTGGGAVQMTGGTLVDCEVVSCYTKYNTDQSGSGVYASGSGCLIDRCYVHGCYFAADKPCYGAVALLNGAKMRNSVIASNTSAWSGGVLLTGSSVMENCTVIDNKASKANSAGGVAVGSDGLATVVNTIIWNNTNTTDHVRRETTGLAERFDTCWTEDPVFKSRGDKWLLRTQSPCMNAGKPLDWMDGATDIYGNPRVRYGTPDIGAVESPYDPGFMLIVR